MILYDEITGRLRAAGMIPHKAVTAYEVIHPDHSPVNKLDETYQRLIFADQVDQLRAVEMQTISHSPAVTGNIVVIPTVAGVDRPAVVIPVGAAWQRVVVWLYAASGTLSFRIDTTDPRYTLTDGTNIITAYLRCIKTWEDNL